MSVNVAPKTASRRFRFGLRTGFGAIAIVALAFGLLDYWIRGPYRAEQRAAVVFTRLGGRVILVDDTQGWLFKHIWPGLLDLRVAAVVDLSHSRVTDNDMVHLRAFDHFGQINLSDTAIGNEGLEQIRQVVGDRFIDLSRTRITDTSALFGDRWRDHPLGLRLSGNQVANGTIIPPLKVFCQLQALDLSDTDADDATLAKIPVGLSSLNHLDLSGTNVTDSGLDSLIKLEGLTKLDLGRTKVTAEGIARLKARWKGRRPLAVAKGATRFPIPPYGSVPKQ
jgi:Leucine Rich repeat